jgi:membrane-associated phospholipid phosphatase
VRTFLELFAWIAISLWLSGCARFQPRSTLPPPTSGGMTSQSPKEQFETGGNQPDRPRLISLELPAEARQDQPSGKPAYTEPLLSAEYGKLLLQDTREVFTAPLRWDTKDWLTVSLAGASVAGLMFVDKPIQDFLRSHRNGTTDSLSEHIAPLGAEYSAAILAGFYCGGALFDDPKARAVAQDGLAASLIASGMIAPALKVAVGRARPADDQGPRECDPFLVHNSSFPSGHSTQAFAVASVIAAHYDALWIKITAYGGASAVAFARVEGNHHFTSDVVAGALIGTFVGNTVVHYNQRKRAEHAARKVSFAPLLAPGSVGLLMSYTF